MDEVKEKYHILETKLNNCLENNRCFRVASEKTGFQKAHIFFGISFLLTIIFFFGFGAQLFCGLIGFGYPAYASFLAIESKSTDDDKQWLTYWVVFSLLHLIEFMFLSHLPDYYFLFKICFLLWLFLPQFKGACILYQQVVKPAMNSLCKKCKSEQKAE